MPENSNSNSKVPLSYAVLDAPRRIDLDCTNEIKLNVKFGFSVPVASDES